MRSVAQRNDSIIIPDGKRFVKSEKKFGAIRVISGEQYLVMPENTWATAYKKAVKDAGFETSFCQIRSGETSRGSYSRIVAAFAFLWRGQSLSKSARLHFGRAKSQSSVGAGYGNCDGTLSGRSQNA